MRSPHQPHYRTRDGESFTVTGSKQAVQACVARCKALIEEAKKSTTVEVVIEESAAYDSQSNGMIESVVQQIEKQIDVIKAFYHTDKETIFQETALYKVKSSSLFEERHIQNIIKKSQANIVTVSPEFFVIEKTGFREETEKLRNKLEPYGLMQFVRSGRISVTKAKMDVSEILNSFKNKN